MMDSHVKITVDQVNWFQVSEGELLNLIGKIQSVDGDKVVILPEHEDLKVNWGFNEGYESLHVYVPVAYWKVAYLQ